MKIQCIPTLRNLSPRKNEKAIAFKGVTPMCWRRKDEGKHHEKYFESTRKNSHHAHTVGENSMKQKNTLSIATFFSLPSNFCQNTGFLTFIFLENSSIVWDSVLKIIFKNSTKY